LRPLRPTSADDRQAELDSLLERITSDSIHQEISTGPPVGREAW
jgi:hypothetical protein